MVVVHATGDLVLEREDTADLFHPAGPTLAEADLVIGHLEVPHTEATVSMTTDVPAVPAPPSALDGVAAAGFDVLTLAGNHVFDLGAEGIDDTRRHSADRGMRTAGAGPDEEAAWTPALLERDGVRIAVLSVNCVGPREARAGSAKPGCAAVDVHTHYASRGANPGGPPRVFTFADPSDLASLSDHVARWAEEAVVIVALHKGLVHQPVVIADYEYEIAHAAIDAGASAVIGHHAHIMKGVELYRDRPIFHGLGNFVTVTRALGGQNDSPERRAWARERVALFGFAPDSDTPEYPFHPDSRNTAIAVMDIDERGRVEARLVPCRIDRECRPVPLGPGGAGDDVADYIRAITRDAGLNTEFAWRGTHLTVQPTKEIMR